MKKVGIVTIHSYKNYGSVLQAYATQREYEKRGYQAEIINFIRENSADKNYVRWIVQSDKQFSHNLPKRVAAWCIIWFSFRKFKRVINAFIKDYLHVVGKEMYEEKELYTFGKDYDIYCTGSDQVWNSKCNGNQIVGPYYLNFVSKENIKVAYSASFGKDSLEKWEEERVKELLAEYDLISVREKSGIQILAEMDIKNYMNVLDPTLMLNRQEWQSIMQGYKVSGKYILVYQICKNKQMDEFIKRIAKSKKMKVLRIGIRFDHALRYGKTAMMPTVSQFLYLIDHAEFIITDSFHGTAFSINFHKNFIVINERQYNERIYNILNILGIEDRLVMDYQENGVLDNPIDYYVVEKKLMEQRKQTDIFFEQLQSIIK